MEIKHKKNISAELKFEREKKLFMQLILVFKYLH